MRRNIAIFFMAVSAFFIGLGGGQIQAQEEYLDVPIRVRWDNVSKHNRPIIETKIMEDEEDSGHSIILSEQNNWSGLIKGVYRDPYSRYKLTSRVLDGEGSIDDYQLYNLSRGAVLNIRGNDTTNITFRMKDLTGNRLAYSQVYIYDENNNFVKSISLKPGAQKSDCFVDSYNKDGNFINYSLKTAEEDIFEYKITANYDEYNLRIEFNIEREEIEIPVENPADKEALDKDDKNEDGSDNLDGDTSVENPADKEALDKDDKNEDGSENIDGNGSVESPADKEALDKDDKDEDGSENIDGNGSVESPADKEALDKDDKNEDGSDNLDGDTSVENPADKEALDKDDKNEDGSENIDGNGSVESPADKEALDKDDKNEDGSDNLDGDTSVENPTDEEDEDSGISENPIQPNEKDMEDDQVKIPEEPDLPCDLEEEGPHSPLIPSYPVEPEKEAAAIKNKEKIKLSLVSVWNLTDSRMNKKNYKDLKVSYNLYANGRLIDSLDLSIFDKIKPSNPYYELLNDKKIKNKENIWHGEFENLDKYDDEGRLIKYDIIQVSRMNGFNFSFEKKGDNFIFSQNQIPKAFIKLPEILESQHIRVENTSLDMETSKRYTLEESKEIPNREHYSIKSPRDTKKLVENEIPVGKVNLSKGDSINPNYDLDLVKNKGPVKTGLFLLLLLIIYLVKKYSDKKEKTN